MTLREAAEEVVLYVANRLANGEESRFAHVESIIARCVAAERAACVARAAAELERTNLNPPQRTRVLAAIREKETK